jgi:hypothetical protein
MPNSFPFPAWARAQVTRLKTETPVDPFQLVLILVTAGITGAAVMAWALSSIGAESTARDHDPVTDIRVWDEYGPDGELQHCISTRIDGTQVGHHCRPAQ